MRLPSQNIISPDRVILSIRQRFNPTKGITADALSNADDEFDRGNLRNAALMWEVIEDRDDLVKAVAGKRKKNIAATDLKSSRSRRKARTVTSKPSSKR